MNRLVIFGYEGTIIDNAGMTSNVLNSVISDGLHLVEGVKALLENLVSPACIISRSNIDCTNEVLATHKIKKFFQSPVYISQADDNPNSLSKTYDQTIYEQKALKRNCIAIESTTVGILAAKAAGIEVVGFAGARHFDEKLTHELKKQKPDYFCEDVSDLYEILLGDF